MSGTGDPPGDLGGLFLLERSRLLELLASLEQADWELATPCPAWTVRGLACHLLADDLGIVSRQRDGHFGARPPEGSDEAAFIAWLDELTQAWVTAARVLSPRVIVDLLAWSGPQVAAVFAVQDPFAPESHVEWAGSDAVANWLHQCRELSESWIHRQQLLDALGRANDLRPDLLAPVLDGLRWAYPYRLAHLRRPRGATLTIEISGAAPVVWSLVSSGERWEFAAQPGDEVARASLSDDEAWRLLTNNLAPDRQATLSLSDDAEVLDVVRRTRAIIGEPT